jgi:hypothetical protein
MFLAVGEAKAKNDMDCKEGELHSLLILSRQPAGSETDEAAARKGAAFAGWRRVKVERSARLPGPPSDARLRAAYDDAMELGCSVIADRRVLNAPEDADERNRRAKKHKA